MRVALAQINTSVGALDSNLRRMADFLTKAKAKRADLTVFPELSSVGYPPKDLLEQEGFVEYARRRLEEFAQRHKDQRFVVGFVDEDPDVVGKGRYNAAAYVEGGVIREIYRKRLLPTYDVFDEYRYFDAGTKPIAFEVEGVKFGLSICEDIWNDAEILGKKLYQFQPVHELVEQEKVDVVINISASPYHVGKQDIRHKLVSNLVKEIDVPVLMTNLTGGNDELLFDGGSFAVDSEGRLFARAKVFEEDLIIVDLATKEGDIRDEPTEELEWVRRALRMGIHDYVKKCTFENVVIGLSGGIDSTLVAMLAVDALGREAVSGVSMPSEFTSEASKLDARELAENLGIEFHEIPIGALVSAAESSLSTLFNGKTRDVTEENIQARARGLLLMAVSNKFKRLVLSTGNKSEMAVGYCTQYGDMVGGLAAISDLPKQMVYALAKHMDKSLNAVPKNIFERPPSAELSPDQKDEDSLPPYDILDGVLQLYIEERLNRDSIVEKGFSADVVDDIIALVDRNEFKRKQAPPGLRLSKKSLGIGRRMPIAREGL